MTNRTWIDEVEERANSTTSEKWSVVNDEYGLRIPEIKGVCEGCIGWLKPYYEEDAEFIAAARTDVPELCRRLKMAIEALREDGYRELLIEQLEDAPKEGE